MTLLLREVAGFVVGAGLWLVALSVVAGATAAAVLFAVERRVSLRDGGAALVAGAIVAGLAHRVGVEVWAPDVAGRPLPVLWAAAGSGALAVAITMNRRRSGT